MGSIYQKAQKEQTKGFYQEVLDRLESLPADCPDWREAVKVILDDAIQSAEQAPTVTHEVVGTGVWNFLNEKSQPVFVQDETISLCPITLADENFYHSVRMQYSQIYKDAYRIAEERKENLFENDALKPEVFYCIIKDAKRSLPLGYLGIKDTSADLWEIAIELDGNYTHQGYGSRGIRLYLNEIQWITGRDDFKAVVEVDNIPSQKCFEKLGAQLVGLCDSAVLKTADEKERFEKRNLDLIDAHMVELAERLGVEPRKLLSHVLEYRLCCPL